MVRGSICAEFVDGIWRHRAWKAVNVTLSDRGHRRPDPNFIHWSQARRHQDLKADTERNSVLAAHLAQSEL